jgi:hypothetical protein
MVPAVAAAHDRRSLPSDLSSSRELCSTKGIQYEISTPARPSSLRNVRTTLVELPRDYSSVNTVYCINESVITRSTFEQRTSDERAYGERRADARRAGGWRAGGRGEERRGAGEGGAGGQGGRDQRGERGQRGRGKRAANGRVKVPRKQCLSNS